MGLAAVAFWRKGDARASSGRREPLGVPSELGCERRRLAQSDFERDQLRPKWTRAPVQYVNEGKPFSVLKLDFPVREQSGLDGVRGGVRTTLERPAFLK
jgi:hypothetical protein